MIQKQQIMDLVYNRQSLESKLNELEDDDCDDLVNIKDILKECH